MNNVNLALFAGFNDYYGGRAVDFLPRTRDVSDPNVQTGQRRQPRRLRGRQARVYAVPAEFKDMNLAIYVGKFDSVVATSTASESLVVLSVTPSLIADMSAAVRSGSRRG